MTKELPKLMSIQQALKYFNIKSRNTLKKNFLDKGLKITTIGGVKRIDQTDADAFLEAHKQ